MNAAIFLGLVQRGDGRYQLTVEGRRIMGQDIHGRNLALAREMLRPRFLRLAMKTSIERGELISVSDMSDIMRVEGITLSDSTVARRARTARAWMKWLLDNRAED